MILVIDISVNVIESYVLIISWIVNISLAKMATYFFHWCCSGQWWAALSGKEVPSLKSCLLLPNASGSLHPIKNWFRGLKAQSPHPNMGLVWRAILALELPLRPLFRLHNSLASRQSYFLFFPISFSSLLHIVILW